MQEASGRTSRGTKRVGIDMFVVDGGQGPGAEAGREGAPVTTDPPAPFPASRGHFRATEGRRQVLVGGDRGRGAGPGTARRLTCPPRDPIVTVNADSTDPCPAPTAAPNAAASWHPCWHGPSPSSGTG